MPIEQALLIAASLDDHSTHPVAQALVAGWREKQPDAQLLPIENFSLLNGRGVTGCIHDQTWHLVNHRLFDFVVVCSSNLDSRLAVLDYSVTTSIFFFPPPCPFSL